MSEPRLKCENYAIFKQIFTLKLLIAFEMAYSCCFSLGEIYIFQNSSKKRFLNQLLVLYCEISQYDWML